MTQRNIAMCIVLSKVTCGIYGIYWYYNIANDLYNEDSTTLPTTPPITTVLYLVTCSIYGIFAFFKWGQALPAIAAGKGVNTIEDRAIIYLILSLFGLSIVNMALVQNDLNQIAASNGAGA